MFKKIIFVLLLVGLAALASCSVQNKQETQSSTNSQYANIQGPDDWTSSTAIKLYDGLKREWIDATYADVDNSNEFIVGDYLYATTENGGLSVKPELDISLLEGASATFDPDVSVLPKPDDIVYLFKSPNDQQAKGHYYLKTVKLDSEVIYYGKVWKWELSEDQKHYKVSDTGHVFAEITATHEDFHEDDILELTIKFDTCGKEGTITGSDEHPFYVLDVNDYVNMVDLEAGMKLKTDTGVGAEVLSLIRLDEPQPLYNLTVAHVENFFVHTSEDEPGVLVHNTGPCDISDILAKYPLNTMLCKECANEVFNRFTQSGLSPQIGRIEINPNGINPPYLNLKDGRMVSEITGSRSNPISPHHYFVEVDGRVYDSITGSGGLPINEYKNLFVEGTFDSDVFNILYQSTPLK